jgi:hypothetical protein
MERIVNLDLPLLYGDIFNDLKDLNRVKHEDYFETHVMFFFRKIENLFSLGILTCDEYEYFESFILFKQNPELYYSNEFELFDLIHDCNLATKGYYKINQQFDFLKEIMIEKYEVLLKKMPYNIFLNCNYWFIISEYKKEFIGKRCQLCNSDKYLNTHHRNYKNKGIEYKNIHELTVLCNKCHSKFHNK